MWLYLDWKLKIQITQKRQTTQRKQTTLENTKEIALNTQDFHFSVCEYFFWCNNASSSISPSYCFCTVTVYYSIFFFHPITWTVRCSHFNLADWLYLWDFQCSASYYFLQLTTAISSSTFWQRSHWLIAFDRTGTILDAYICFWDQKLLEKWEDE